MISPILIVLAGLMGAAGIVLAAASVHAAPAAGLDSAGYMLLFHAAAVLAGEYEGAITVKHGPVCNYVERTGARIVLKPASAEVRLQPRATTLQRDPWVGNLIVSQSDVRTQNVFLRCVQGGTPGAPESGVVAQSRRLFSSAMVAVDVVGTPASEFAHRLRFAFLLYDRVIETQLLLAASSGASMRIPIQSATDIIAHAIYGDELEIVDAATNARTTYKITAKTDVPASGWTTLTVSPTIALSYALGQHLMIRSFRSNRWSDAAQGVATLGASISGSGSPGDLITLTLSSTTQTPRFSVVKVDSEELRITAILGATQATAARAVGGTTVAAHDNGRPVQCYVAPIQNTAIKTGALFAIGATGVSIALTPPTGVDEEMPLVPGDTIDITCPGLTLEPQDLATVIAQRQSSIDKVGNKPYPSRRAGRLASSAQAREGAWRDLGDFGDAHHGVTWAGPLQMLPALGGTYLVRDDLLLPHDGGVNPNGDASPVSPDTATAIACRLESRAIDLLKDALTLSLTAFRANPW